MAAYSFAFVILKAISPAILDITQFLVQFDSRWTLQLINSISKKYLNNLVEQLLLHFFNDPAAARFPEILDLYLNGDELATVTSLFIVN